jgi:hypothetical protein
MDMDMDMDMGMGMGMDMDIDMDHTCRTCHSRHTYRNLHTYHACRAHLVCFDVENVALASSDHIRNLVDKSHTIAPTCRDEHV